MTIMRKSLLCKSMLAGLMVLLQLTLVCIYTPPAPDDYHHPADQSNLPVGKSWQQEFSSSSSSFQRLQQKKKPQRPQEEEEEAEEAEAESQQTHFAAFFNIFIAHYPKKAKHALRIADEQLLHVHEAMKRSKHYLNFTVYYATVGKSGVISEDYMHRRCERYGLQCQHLLHSNAGFEEVTLQKLYDYCQTHEDERVLYFHSKGSYHRTQDNENWRCHMMNGILHPDCLHPPHSPKHDHQQCNVCGLHFQPVWMPMIPGNFWTAQCDYVNQLIPPVHFDAKSTQALQPIFETTSLNFTSHLYKKIDLWNTGLGRHAQEAWIASHPAVMPCDLSKEPNVTYWFQPLLNESNTEASLFHWSMAPRFPLADTDWFHLKQEELQQIVLPDKSVRIREFFLLAGKLYKWIRLYGDIPPESSWVWSFFPDADEWRDAWTKYGNKTVETMLSKYTLP